MVGLGGLEALTSPLSVVNKQCEDRFRRFAIVLNCRTSTGDLLPCSATTVSYRKIPAYPKCSLGELLVVRSECRISPGGLLHSIKE